MPYINEATAPEAPPTDFYTAFTDFEGWRSKLPTEHQAVVDSRFALTPPENLDAERKRWLGVNYVAERTGRDAGEVSKNFENYYMPQFAGNAGGLGLSTADTPADANGFFDRVKGHVTKLKDESETARWAASDATIAAASPQWGSIRQLADWKARAESKPGWNDKHSATWMKQYEHTTGLLVPHRKMIADTVEAMSKNMEGLVSDDGAEKVLATTRETLIDLPDEERRAFIAALATAGRTRGEASGKADIPQFLRELSATMGGVKGDATGAAVSLLVQGGEALGRMLGQGMSGRQLHAAALERVPEKGRVATTVGVIDTPAKAREFVSEQVSGYFTQRLADTQANPYPVASTGEEVELTPESSRLIAAAKARSKRAINISRELNDIAESADPIKSVVASTAGTSMGIMVPLALGGPVMIAPMAAVYQNIEYESLSREYPDMAEGDKAMIAAISAAIQAPLDLVTLGALKRLPSLADFLTKGITRTMVGGTLKQAGKSYFVENLVELAQDYSTAGVQGLASALSNDIPGVDWDTERENFWQSRLDVAVGMLPLTLIGLGHSSYQGWRAGKTVLENNQGLGEWGAIEEDRIAIADAIASGDAVKERAAIEAALPRRMPKIAAEFGNEGQAARLAMQQAVSRAQELGMLPRIRRTDEGFSVRVGSESVHVGSFEAAQTLALGHLNEHEQEQQAAIAEIAGTLIDQGFTAEVWEQSPSENRTIGDEMKAGLSEADAIDAVRVAAQMEGLTASEAAAETAAVLGSTRAEMIDQVKTMVSRGYQQASVVTPIEEIIEGRWKAGLASGHYTHQQGKAWVNMVEKATGLQFLAPDREASPREVLEAISKIVVADVTGRDKGGDHFTAGTISRGLKAQMAGYAQRAGEADADLNAKEAGKFRTFLRAFRALVAQVFHRARAIAKARKDGKLGEDFDAFLDDLMGASAEQRFQSEVERQVGAMADAVEAEAGAMLGDGGASHSITTFSISSAELRAKLETAPDVTTLGALGITEGFHANDGGLLSPSFEPRVSRQSRRGGRHVGFYMAPEASETTQYGGTLHTIPLGPDTLVAVLRRPGQVERITPEEREQYAADDVYVVVGPAIIGSRVEIAVLGEAGLNSEAGQRRAVPADASRVVEMPVKILEENGKPVESDSAWQETFSLSPLTAAHHAAANASNAANSHLVSSAKTAEAWDEFHAASNAAQVIHDVPKAEKRGKNEAGWRARLDAAIAIKDALYSKLKAIDPEGVAERERLKALKNAPRQRVKFELTPSDVRSYLENKIHGDLPAQLTGATLWQLSHGDENTSPSYAFDLKALRYESGEAKMMLSSRRLTSEDLKTIAEQGDLDELDFNTIERFNPESALEGQDQKFRRWLESSKFTGPHAITDSPFFSDLSIDYKAASMQSRSRYYTARLTIKPGQEAAALEHVVDQGFSPDLIDSEDGEPAQLTLEARISDHMPGFSAKSEPDIDVRVGSRDEIRGRVGLGMDSPTTHAPTWTRAYTELPSTIYSALHDSGDIDYNFWGPPEESESAYDKSVESLGYAWLQGVIQEQQGPAVASEASEPVGSTALRQRADQNLPDTTPTPENSNTFSLSPARRVDLVTNRVQLIMDSKSLGAQKYISNATDNLARLKLRWADMPTPKTKAELNKGQAEVANDRRAELEKRLVGEIEHRMGGVHSLTFKLRKHDLADGLIRGDARRKRFWVGKLKAPARWRAEQAEKGETMPGDYDGVDGIPRMFFMGDTEPAVLAQQLHDEGLISAPTPDALWDGIRSMLDEIASNKEQWSNYKAQLTEASQQAKAEGEYEGRAWRAEQDAEQARLGSPRDAAVRDMAAMEAMAMALPAEVRAKLPLGWSSIAGLKGDKEFAKAIAERVKRIDVELTRHWKAKNAESLELLLRLGQGKTEPGKKPRGTATPEVHAYFKEVAAVVELTPQRLVELKLGIAAALEAADENTDEVDLMRRKDVADKWGGFETLSVRDQTAALEEGWATYRTGRNTWQSSEEQRLAGIREDAQSINDTFTGTYGELTRQRAKGVLSWIQDSGATLKDSHGFLRYTLGDHPLVARWSEAIRAATLAREVAAAKLSTEWKAAMTAAMPTLSDNKRAQRFYEMNQKRFISVNLTEEKPDARINAKRREELLKEGWSPEQISDTAILTEAEAMTVTLTWGQPRYKASLERSGFTESIVKTLEAALSPEAKSLREWMRGKLKDQQPEISDVFARVAGMKLPRIENYWPGRFYSAGKEQVIDPTGSGVVATGFADGWLRERRDHAAFVKLENAFSTFFGHMGQTAHWMAFVEPLREINGVLRNPSVKKSLESGIGDNSAKALNLWAALLETNGDSNQGTALDKGLVPWMLSRYSQGRLAWNPFSIIKQAPAMFNAGFAEDLGLGAFVSGWGGVLRNPSNFADIAMELWESPEIQTRLIGGTSAEMREAMAAVWRSGPGQGQAFMERGMNILGQGDTFFTVLGASAAYEGYARQFEKDGMTPEQAHARAMELARKGITETAQPTTTDRQSLYNLKRGVWGRMLAMFMGDSVQKFSLYAEGLGDMGVNWRPSDWHKVKKASKAKVLTQWLLLGPAMQVLASMIRDATDGHDDDWIDDDNWNPWNFVVASLLGPLRGIFFAGQIVDVLQAKISGKRIFSGKANPMEETVVGGLSEAGKLVTMPFDGKDDTMGEYADQLISVAEHVPGIGMIVAGTVKKIERLTRD